MTTVPTDPRQPRPVRIANCSGFFGDRLSAPEPFANSFAMHKVLDLIGDLYLLGRPLIARVIAYRTGHVQNRTLAARIAEQLT